MRIKGFGTIVSLLVLLFIFMGDRILPQPLNQWSRNTRNTINQYLLGLFPKQEIEPPSHQRDRAIQQFERRAEPSSK